MPSAPDTFTGPRAAAGAIRTHARAAHPHECCGFLVGHRRRIVHVVAMRNVARPPETSYRIDPADHIALRRWLRRLQPPLEIVGVYHSHPRGPAQPSPTDVREAHYPEWIHVIAGRAGARVTLAGFRIEAGRVRRVRLDWRG